MKKLLGIILGIVLLSGCENNPTAPRVEGNAIYDIDWTCGMVSTKVKGDEFKFAKMGDTLFVDNVVFATTPDVGYKSIINTMVSSGWKDIYINARLTNYTGRVHIYWRRSE